MAYLDYHFFSEAQEAGMEALNRQVQLQDADVMEQAAATLRSKYLGDYRCVYEDFTSKVISDDSYYTFGCYPESDNGAAFVDAEPEQPMPYTPEPEPPMSEQPPPYTLPVEVIQLPGFPIPVARPEPQPMPIPGELPPYVGPTPDEGPELPFPPESNTGLIVGALVLGGLFLASTARRRGR